MPDPIAFERLGLACLRHIAADECASLIHLGSSSEGKAANSKLDAFTRVPWSTPPLFVAAHFTTEKKIKLHGKWFGVSKTPKPQKGKSKQNLKRSLKRQLDADIPKSIREAATIRANFPSARFKLYLVTNRLVDQTLQTDVYKAASVSEPVIDIEIIEQSRLSGFLDQDKEGQYLRQAMLGIPASRVSRSLLAATGRQMLENRRYQPDMAEARSVIARHIQESVRVACATVQHSLVWLVAEPGKGKSLIAMAEFQRHLDHGGVALWIDEEDTAGARSLEEAVVRALKRRQPSLCYDDVAEVLRLFTPTDRLLVFVDDINRVNDPGQILDHIRSWANRMAHGGKDVSESPIMLLCPVWQRHFKSNDTAKDSTSISPWECIVEIADFTPEESKLLLNQTTLSHELREMVHQLAGGEPYLTGWLVNTLVCDTAASTRRKVPSLDELLDERLKRITTQKKNRATSEFIEAILELSRWMLVSHQLAPTMEAVLTVFRDSPHIWVLRELLSDGAIIHQAHDRLRFSHDRLRDIWLARALPKIIDQAEVHSEPHFAEIIGRALADDRITLDQLEIIAQTNPLALFCAWQLLSPKQDAPARSPVLSAIKKWLREANLNKDQWDPITWEITRKLDNTTDPVVVLECYRLLPLRPLLMLAALKNGLVAAGIQYVQRNLQHSFPPSITDPWFDQAVADALDKHRAAVVGDLKEVFHKHEASNDQLEACILLSGFLGLSEFGSILSYTWRRASTEQRQEWVGSYLWATARCLGNSATTEWEEGLKTWLTLSPETADSHVSSPQWYVAGWQLARVHGAWLSDSLAAWMSNLIVTEHPLHKELTAVLIEADAPSAVEFVVREQGTKRRKTPQSSGIGWWLSMRRPGRRNREELKLSEASLARLHTIWSSDIEAKEDRIAALTYWCAVTDGAAIPLLFGLAADSFLQATALPHRMRLRDATCVLLVIKHLPEHPYWLQMLPSIWTRPLRNVVNQMLTNYESPSWQHQTFEMLIAIPAEDAEFLILSNAAKLQADPMILQAAALVGTRRLHDWVFQAAPTSPDQRREIFAHVELQINMGRAYRPASACPLRWRRNLEPFLDWFSPEELEHFMRDWNGQSFMEWAHTHIMPRLPADLQVKHARTKENLLAILQEDSSESHWDWMAGHFLERAQAQGWTQDRILEILYSWAEQRRDDFSYISLASCIARTGTRVDLGRLDALLLLRSSEKLVRIRENTDFTIRRRTL